MNSREAARDAFIQPGAETLPTRAVPGDRLTICFPFAGDSLGGSHVSVLGLLRQLPASHYRIVVAPEVRHGRIARLFDGFEIVEPPSSRADPFAPGEPFGLHKFTRTFADILPRARFLRRQGVDIVHTNDGRTHAAWGLAARLAKTRLVWHHRGDPNALGLRLIAPLLANKILSVSRFALPPGRLWTALTDAKIVHSPFDIHLEVDRRLARADLVRQAGIPEHALVCAYVGSFVQRKRPLLFIDAMARLRDLIDRPVFGLMFGEAKSPVMDEAIRAHIDARGAADIIKLMGYRTPGAWWIGACDQLVVSAVNEPFGRTLVEAMLVGTPIVATKSGGNVEALQGELGVLVPPDDAEAIARACANLAATPSATTMMTRRARTEALRRFGEERHGEAVRQVYAELSA